MSPVRTLAFELDTDSGKIRGDRETLTATTILVRSFVSNLRPYLSRCRAFWVRSWNSMSFPLRARDLSPPNHARCRRSQARFSFRFGATK